MAVKTITFTMGSEPVVTCVAKITSSINSSNTVTFKVDWTLKDLGSNEYGDYYWNGGVLLQCATGKADATDGGGIVYGSYATKKTISVGTKDENARTKWDDITGSFTVTVSGCTSVTNAGIKLRLINNYPTSAYYQTVGTGVASVHDIVKLTVAAGTGISAVSKSPNQTYHIAGDSITVNATVATSTTTGYENVFGKWTSSNTSYTANSTSQKYTFAVSDAENITLTASASQTPWTSTLYFHPNGGTAVDAYPLITDSSSEYYGFSSHQQKPTYAWTDSNVTNVSTLFTRTGYHIADGTQAWILNTVDSGVYLTQGNADFSTIITTDEQIIKAYANWTPNTYTITYKPNGASQESYSSTHTYGVSAYLTDNAFEREGYTFVGWATSPNNAATYANQASVLNLTTTNDADVILYAIWQSVDGEVNKELNARIMNKRDTESEWESYDPLLLNGELAIVDKTDGTIGAKIGNGVLSYNNLPFAFEGLNTKYVTDEVVDLNNYTEGGIYFFSVSSDGTTTINNIPTGVNGWLVVLPLNDYDGNGTTLCKQIWYRYGTANTNDFNTFVRTYVSSGTWSAWKQYKMVEDTGWIDLPLSTSVMALSYGGSTVPEYRKIDDHVIVRGCVDVTYSSDGTATIATLPSGFRPATPIHLLTASESVYVTQLYISTGGVITLKWSASILTDTKITSGTYWVYVCFDFYV